MESGIRNPESGIRKRNTESVKEGSKRSIGKTNISNDNKINKQIKKKTQMNKLAE